MEHFEISAEWRDALEKTGLGTLQSCLAFQEGKCLSSHLRGDTRKVTLTDGRIVFLKRDFFTFKKEIAKDLLRFKKPQPKTEKERLAFAMARKAGFIAPEVIAWGQTRRYGFPDTACLIMLPLDGVDLDKYLRSETDETKRKSFIEKAEQTIDMKKAAELEEKLRKQRFTLNDYLDQFRQLKNMGSMEQLMSMMPGMKPGALKDAKVDEKMIDRMESMILSMTPDERERPDILNGSRKRRIAAGSGTTVEDINRMLKQYEQVQKLAKQFSQKNFKGFGRGFKM